MKSLLAVAPALLLAACAAAPVRPQPQAQVQAQVHQDTREAALAGEREARRRVEMDRQAEARRSVAQGPVAGSISSAPHIAARPLEPTPEKASEPAIKASEPAPKAFERPKLSDASPKIAAEPARQDPAVLAWQLSDDLRRLHARADVQTFYSERGWVVSLPAEALFEPGDAGIRPGAEHTLDSLARVLRHYAARGIVMEGPYPERAQIVRRALTERGVPGERITADGTGERIEFLVPHAHLNAGTGR